MTNKGGSEQESSGFLLCRWRDTYTQGENSSVHYSGNPGSKHSFMCILGKARRDALQPCVRVDMFSFRLPNLRCVP